MKSKSFTLFSNVENNIQTYIQCVINKNGSFENKGRILHIKSNGQPNNDKRKERYKLNKERKQKLNKELTRLKESMEKSKWLEKEMKRYESNTQEINMDSELEDMESYI